MIEAIERIVKDEKKKLSNKNEPWNRLSMD